MSNIINLEERRKARAEKAAQEAALAEQAKQDKANSQNVRIERKKDYYSVTFKSYQKYYKYPTQEDEQ